MLILFDVDATLITSHRAGVHAMGAAGRALFGDGFDEHRVEYAGRLDPLIIADLLVAHGQASGPAEVDRFREAYGAHLPAAVEGQAKACPGVFELLDALEAAAPAPTLALLTGNYPETGRIKLEAAGVGVDRFAIHVWGCDSPHVPPARSHLPPVALERYRAHAQRELEAGDVTVIGDTPHDVACARDNGMRSIGVATGLFSRGQLAESGADLAVDDLTDTEGIMRWIMGKA